MRVLELIRWESPAPPPEWIVGFTAVLMWSLLAVLTAASGRVPPFQLAAMTFAVGGSIGAATWLVRPDAAKVLQRTGLDYVDHNVLKLDAGAVKGPPELVRREGPSRSIGLTAAGVLYACVEDALSYGVKEAVFDFTTGVFISPPKDISNTFVRSSRAPRWMGEWGLEWLYRLGHEPQRLAGRYLKDAIWMLPLTARALHTRLVSRGAEAA